MMKKLALVAAGILCTGLLGACSSQGMATSNKDMSQQTAKAGARQPSGKKVKEFNLQGVDGKAYRLSDYKGKKVYLKFWASWCSICLSTLGDTNDLAKAEEGKDYVDVYQRQVLDGHIHNWHKNFSYPQKQYQNEAHVNNQIAYLNLKWEKMPDHNADDFGLVFIGSK